MGDVEEREGVLEGKTSLWHTNVRGCGRRKIHDQDAIATPDRIREDSQTRLNQQICLSERHEVLVGLSDFLKDYILYF